MKNRKFFGNCNIEIKAETKYNQYMIFAGEKFPVYMCQIVRYCQLCVVVVVVVAPAGVQRQIFECEMKMTTNITSPWRNDNNKYKNQWAKILIRTHTVFYILTHAHTHISYMWGVVWLRGA